MKATLEFNLPEDYEEFEMAVMTGNYYSFIWEFGQFIRKEIKYNSDDEHDEYRKALQIVKDKYFELLKSNKVSLD